MDKKELIEKLNQVGVNTEKAIARFMGNDDLYITFIRRLPQNIRFNEIRDALELKDEENFYMKVHDLKGTTGNLGVDTIFECAQAILVEFRSSKFKQSKKLKELVKEAELQSELLSKIILHYEQKNGVE